MNIRRSAAAVGAAAELICRVLAKRGHQIHVLTSHLSGMPREEERDGCQITRVPCLRTQPYRASFLSMALYVLGGLWSARRLMKDFQPDVIHVHFAVPGGALAWLLAKLYRLPYLLTIQLGDVPGGVPEKTGTWFRLVFPFTPGIWSRAARIVAVSEFTRQLALRNYDQDIQVIPNGIDLNCSASEPVQVNDCPRLVFAGRFMAQKDPVQVVRILKELKDLPWECVMIGDGPLMPEVKQEIEAQSLEDRFKLTGWIVPEQVLEWFEQSDILFMPSLSEGLPVVGVQALSRGLAIVASRAGGFVDLVADGENGYLVDRQDTARFVVRLGELLSDRQRLLAFRKSSLKKAVDFDIDRVVDEYERLFTEIVKK